MVLISNAFPAYDPATDAANGGQQGVVIYDGAKLLTVVDLMFPFASLPDSRLLI